MKKCIITIILSLFYLSIVNAQRTCGSELNMKELQHNNPKMYGIIMNYEKSAKSQLKQVRMSSNFKIIVPVVVHIVYNTSSQNISNEQVLSQIEVLNEDFSRTNEDRVNTPNAFKSVAGNPNIRFELAKLDPNGNSTNGITRTSTNKAYFNSSLNDVKFSSLEGCDAWDTKRYLNIWVCNLGENLLGYAQFPFQFSSSPNTDGVVINYESFGRYGNTKYPYNKGRTTTHEVGHWLNLRHIWGDEEGCNNGTDYCDDTPNHMKPNFECAQLNASCSSTGDMYMNYMDYTKDGCMNLFTKDQVIRMRVVFNDVRNKMLDENENLIIAYGLKISGSNLICDQSTYTIENLPAGATVNWSTSNGKLQLISGQGTATATFRKAGYGKGQIQATISINGSSITISKDDILVGKPSFTFYTEPVGNNYLQIELVGANGTDITNQNITSTIWEKVSGSGGCYSSINGNGFYATANGNCNNWVLNAKIQATNACGATTENTTFTPPAQQDPCDDYYQIEQIDNNTYVINQVIDNPCDKLYSQHSSNTNIQVIVSDLYGNTLIKTDKKELDITNLQDGIYIIIAYVKNKVITKQIIKQSN